MLLLHKVSPVHTAKKIYKSKKSPGIQQNSGLFCFQTLAKNTIKKRSKRLIRPHFYRSLFSIIQYFTYNKLAFSSSFVNVNFCLESRSC